MSNKVPVSGVVEQVSPTGFKLGGKWFNKAKGADKYQAPGVGQTVSFDAYGANQNIVYAIKETTNGTNGNSAGNPGVLAGAQVRPHIGGSDCRSSALVAAATLLQGSEGNVEQVASNCVAVSRIFEVYLSGQTVTDDEEMI